MHISYTHPLWTPPLQTYIELTCKYLTHAPAEFIHPTDTPDGHTHIHTWQIHTYHTHRKSPTPYRHTETLHTDTLDTHRTHTHAPETRRHTHAHAADTQRSLVHILRVYTRDSHTCTHCSRSQTTHTRPPQRTHRTHMHCRYTCHEDTHPHRTESHPLRDSQLRTSTHSSSELCFFF